MRKPEAVKNHIHRKETKMAKKKGTKKPNKGGKEK
jgi:hypothetical protein